MKLKLGVDVPENLLSDLMITAFDGHYGGCWHWSEPYGDNWLAVVGDERVWKEANILDTNDTDDDIPSRVYTVNWDTLVLGMQRIVDDGKLHSLIENIADAIFDDDGGRLDSGDVDTIVQYGLFMSEVYS